MADESDQVLIGSYVRSRSEQAFGTLVQRHIDLVHSTALRIVRDASLAEDVTQRVFVALVQHAAKLQSRSSLTGWLHETARNLAINTVRTEERRRQREYEAATMNDLDANDARSGWQQIAPFLDDALARLSGAERDLILWRYFERCTAEQIGGRLGLTAEAAQKRVTRALDRLRGIFADRGVTGSAAGLAAVLSTQAVQSAPSGLAAAVAAAASASSLALPTSSILHILMASTKAKLALGLVLASSLTAPLVFQQQKVSRLTNELIAFQQRAPELDRLRAEVERLSAEAQAAEKERGRERAELARLRGQFAAAGAADSKAAGKSLTPAVVGPSKRPEPSPSADERLARADWRNLGFQAPALTLQTLEWAKINGNTKVVADGLAWADEETRNQIKALFAAASPEVKSRYASADAYILGLFDHSGPADDRHTLTSYRILEENFSDTDAKLTVEYNFADGSSHVGPQRYVRIGGDWRQVLDFEPPARDKLGVALEAGGAGVDPGSGGK